MTENKNDESESTSEDFSIQPWQIEELRKRREEYLLNPEAVESWEVVKERIRGRNESRNG